MDKLKQFWFLVIDVWESGMLGINIGRFVIAVLIFFPFVLLRGLFSRFVLGRLRARSKITSHFKRRCIPPGCVAKARNMPDIPALSRLASRAPQHLKLRTYF
ncbi:MAG: hypothetical protein U9R02_15600 [Thermodesulfobacteriota bacterium]|nr:hypothetical protein [Thermodesulfobacteriota bacterium]